MKVVIMFAPHPVVAQVIRKNDMNALSNAPRITVATTSDVGDAVGVLIAIS